LAACVAGAALLAGGFAGVSRAQILPAQVPYIASGALGGLALVAVGITWLLSAQIRSEQHRLTDVEDAIRLRRRTGTTPSPSHPAEETAR
jgi:hypothetical protein